MRFRLGDFIFDVDARQLLRGSTEVHLSPKAFELLKILLDQRPRALSKQELHRQLWPATFVSDTNLATLVAEVRDALGDAARTPRFVRTVHRHGYAFCGDAVAVEDTAEREGAVFCWLIKDGHRLPLSLGENILGRDADGGIQIDSVTVSRRHARIMISAADAVLEDLQSKNGTYVGGEPVSTPIRLANGDEIRTGSISFRFRMTSPKGSTATWTEPSD